MSSPSETTWVSRCFDVCVRPSSRSCSSPLVDPDHLGFGDDVGARCLPDLFSCGVSWEVEPSNVKSREPEVVVMRAVAFRRLGPVIMPVAKVVHPMGHIAGLGLGGSLPQSCLAGD